MINLLIIMMPWTHEGYVTQIVPSWEIVLTQAWSVCKGESDDTGCNKRRADGHEPPVRYVKLRVAHGLGMPGMFTPPTRISDLDMHYGTCITHVPWCMSGSLTSSFLWSRWRENATDIPGACAICNCAYLVRGPWLCCFIEVSVSR